MRSFKANNLKTNWTFKSARLHQPNFSLIAYKHEQECNGKLEKLFWQKAHCVCE